MNKTTIGIVAAVVIIAGGLYAYSQNGGGGMMSGSEKPHTITGSMKELVASGVSQKCDFAEPQSGTTGTIYISGGKIRGDFSSKSQSGTVAGHMISDGTTVNTWIDGLAQGVKTSFTASSTAGNPDAQKGLDPDKKTDYSCSGWQMDPSKFALPTGVTFMDVSAMMKGMPAGGMGGGAGAAGAAGVKPSTGSASQCNSCSVLPEPQKSQCRTALKCQ
jgi:hypothetical protein